MHRNPPNRSKKKTFLVQCTVQVLGVANKKTNPIAPIRHAAKIPLPSLVAAEYKEGSLGRGAIVELGNTRTREKGCSRRHGWKLRRRVGGRTGVRFRWPAAECRHCGEQAASYYWWILTYLLYVAKSFSNKRAKPLLSAQERSSATFRLGKDDGSKTMPCRKTCGEKEARHIEQVCRLHV